MAAPRHPPPLRPLPALPTKGDGQHPSKHPTGTLNPPVQAAPPVPTSHHQTQPRFLPGHTAMAAPAPGCDTPVSGGTALFPPWHRGDKQGWGCLAGRQGVTEPFLSCLRAPRSRPQLPLATLDSWGGQVSVQPQPRCHGPLPPQTLSPCSAATPDPVTVLPCPGATATLNPVTMLPCQPEPRHHVPLPHHTLSIQSPALAPLPPQTQPSQHPASPLCSPNLAGAAAAPWPPSSVGQAPGTPLAPGRPHGQRGVCCVLGGSRVAPLGWQPPGQGRKRPRSRGAVAACGFLAAVSTQPGAASHARPRTRPPRQPRLSQRHTGGTRCPPSGLLGETPPFSSPYPQSIPAVSHRHVSHVPRQA